MAAAYGWDGPCTIYHNAICHRLYARIAASATFPTFGKLSFDFFAASVAPPGPLHRLQRRQCLFKNGHGLTVPMIFHDPQFGPAFDQRQLARGTGKMYVLGHALDAESGQDISQVPDHERVFCRVNFLHAVISPRDSKNDCKTPRRKEIHTNGFVSKFAFGPSWRLCASAGDMIRIFNSLGRSYTYL